MTTTAPAVHRELTRTLPVTVIRPSPTNPRKHFPDGSLKELAASILAQGVEQPLIVRADGENYELVHGERRLRAAKLAGLADVPVVIRSLSPSETMRAQLAEMDSSEGLTPLEKAAAYADALAALGVTQEQLAEQLGVTPGTLSTTLKLLKLPPEAQELLGPEGLTAAHGRELVRLVKKPAQLAQAVAQVRNALDQGGEVGVRQLRAYVDRVQSGKAGTKAHRARKAKAVARDGARREQRGIRERGVGTQVVVAAHNLALGVNGLAKTRPVKVPAHLFAKAAKVLALLKGWR